MTKLKCGCVVGHYWCSKHDIYTGNVPPWGAGEKRAVEQQRVFKEEFDDSDRVPTSCSCHISAPCSFCEKSQFEDDDE